MMFTFAFGYSLSGPMWAIYRLVRKLVTGTPGQKRHSARGIRFRPDRLKDILSQFSKD